MSIHGHGSPRAALPPPPPRIVTNALGPSHRASLQLGGLQSPATASSIGIPFSPFANSPAAYVSSPAAASPMTLRTPTAVPYNPQQWNRCGPVGGQHVAHAQQPLQTRLLDMTGMEASMPSPPPPYSPGQSPNISQSPTPSTHLSGNAFSQRQPPPPPPNTTSSSARPATGFLGRPVSIVSPQSATSVTSNLHFAPPPSRNTPRSASRDKLSSRFGLSTFRSRGTHNDGSPVPSNIESLQIQTSDALLRAPASPRLSGWHANQQYVPNAYVEQQCGPDHILPLRAPAARRAASAGVQGYGGRTPIDESPVISSGHWDRSMTIPPPPPPGPPPSCSRSQSLGPGSGSGSGYGRLASPPAAPTRRPGQTTLGTIPPTPLGWQDDTSANRPRTPAGHGLHAETSSPGPSLLEPNAPWENGSTSTSSGPTIITSQSSSTLNQNVAKSDSSRGIRERRSESRAARERTQPSVDPWAQDVEANFAVPANLELGSPHGSLVRRGAVTQDTPSGGGAFKSSRSDRLSNDPRSPDSTPRADIHQRNMPVAAPTPPFSPGVDGFHQNVQKASVALPSKALPTPPIRSYSGEQGFDSTDSPDVAQRTPSQLSTLSHADSTNEGFSTPKLGNCDGFSQAALERHRVFIENETAAETDQDKLELFAEFIVLESRLRRDRYSAAFDVMAGSIVDLTRDLWRSHGSTTGRRSATPNTQGPPAGRSKHMSKNYTAGGSPDTRFSTSVGTTIASPASSLGNFTPHTEPASPASASSQTGRDAPWNNGTNFHPSLSPIPSMAMSTVPDEQDSRGRTASRWWESDGGSSEIGVGRRFERSKRESKYMSLPKEARENLQWSGDDRRTPRARAEASNSHMYESHGYPPEKAELQESTSPLAQQPPIQYSLLAMRSQDSTKLDVSRLVTLPPPYPRHHPAVNNSHPDLASIRNSLRTLSELEEAKAIRSKFFTKAEAKKGQENASLSNRRSECRYNIQENVRNSIMSYADAAKAEVDFQARENQRAQDVVQQIFDTYQTEVANPLHAMFCERITKATASMDHLKGRLSSEAQEPNPNHTQEEGDAKPELLEMLTLLKWLFEAREQLHKEMFELEDTRNDLYRDIIVLPYAQVNNEQKVKEATVFFQRDAQDRKVVSEKETLTRYEEFLTAIEQNVTRGVEVQLSAFWDIAPGLLAIVQQVPCSLHGFGVQVPQQDYDETPSYHEHPLQYLYTVLAHAGRSAYQFIESQTNLFCLLHEVRTVVMVAGTRLLETQRLLEGEDLANVGQEMKVIRADEEQRLTNDLKEKVGLVESQWQEALGTGLGICKTKVEKFLVEQDGWDDSLRE